MQVYFLSLTAFLKKQKHKKNQTKKQLICIHFAQLRVAHPPWRLRGEEVQG